MLFEPAVHITYGNMLNEIELPKMYRVRQKLSDDCISDIRNHILGEMDRLLQNTDVTGKRIAITVGSRGIGHYGEIIAAVVEGFRKYGAKPFLMTAMGSHAGATEEGQAAMAKHLGVDADKIGVEMLTSMETRIIGYLPNGSPVHCAKDALDSDGIFIVHKIKPHADFKGPHESGLLKMSVIGLGKLNGPSVIHKLGFARFAEVIPQAAEVVFREAPIFGGLAIVENSYHNPVILEGLFKDDIFRRERELLEYTKQSLARLCVRDLDTLIVDQIGKNISGEGMDPNVTGRPGSGLMEGFTHTKIGSIFVRSISDASDGNGVGIGMADISTIRCIQNLDLSPMYTNAIATGMVNPSKLPVLLNNDNEALKIAIRIAAGDHLDCPRVCWIRNTAEMEECLVSEAVLPELQGREGISILEEVPFVFDEENFLVSPFI